MKTKRIFTALFLAMALAFNSVSTVFAVPSLPSSFYGEVKLGGANVPVGTIISARINGVQYASMNAIMNGTDTVYYFDVPGDDPSTPGVIEGGVLGNTVVFYIGPYVADQTALWQSGTDVPLNLTATANNAPVITEGASININMSQDGSMPFSLTLHATDADGDPITWSISSPTSHGAASASGTGSSKAIDYTPTTNYIGSDSFVVQISDGRGGIDTITVNVTITAVPTSFTIFLPLILR